MAITKPLVFTNIGIADADGSNAVFYPLHVSESATITVTPTTDTLDNGQSLGAFYDISFEAVSFNTNLYSDARVYTNTSAEPTLATIIFSGTTGAQTLNIGDVFINGSRAFDGNRTGTVISGTARGVDVNALIALS